MNLYHHLQHWTLSHVSGLTGLPLPDSLDTHGLGKDNDVYQVQQLHGHMDILIHKLLVTAFVSLVPKHKVNNSKSILKPTAKILLFALKLISII